MNNFQPVEVQSNGKWNFKLGNVAGKGLKHNDDIMLLGTPELPPQSDENQFLICKNDINYKLCPLLFSI